MTYRETLRYLYSLQWRGMKFGLRNTRALLKSVGDPHRRFSSIHVAGTNGKGSTSAFLASIAREADLKTGLYTSPHLLRFTERIRLDGQELSEERLVYYVKDLKRAIESVHATFFEATTCIAFRFFADENVDLAVVETGLGGRFDATNVLLPLASVITSIGLDHTQYLGSTPEQIAVEKGGIIKPSVPVIVGSVRGGPMRVLRQIARKREAPLHLASRTAACSVSRVRGGYRMLFRAGIARGCAVVPGLPGAHQVMNAQLAVAAISVLARGRLPGALSPLAVRRGIVRVREHAGLRGRMEIVPGRRGRTILDVGHNPDGIATLVDSLKKEGIRPAAIVFGVMADKDAPTMLARLRPAGGRLFAAAPKMDRALPAPEVGRRAAEAGFDVVAADSVASALKMARRAARGGDVLVTGSHYVVADALDFIENQQS